jgi:hypothetical protein
MALRKLNWQAFSLSTINEALAKRCCLYALHHRRDRNRPYYIGKAKHLGPRNGGEYIASARYNGGYKHLLTGLLRSGFVLYVAELGAQAFRHAVKYEQALIEGWDPICGQRRTKGHLPVDLSRPWGLARNTSLDRTRER